MRNHESTVRYPLSRITLRLALTKEFPEGSLRRGFDIRAVLDAAGHLDIEAWRNHQTAFSVQRIWDDEPVQHGTLLHRAGRMGGATWTVHYGCLTEEDEDGFRLGDHMMQHDEFISIRDDDGVMQAFRVSDVKRTGEALV